MAKITVEYKVKDRLGEFVGLLKDRAMDPVYEGVRDTIADFVDKFLVVELKRLQTSNETRQEELDIPQDVLLEPLRQARTAVDEQFRRLLGGKPLPEARKAAKPELPKPEAKKASKLEDGPADSNGPKNGHYARKKRDLQDSERDIIRAAFLSKNGEIEEDACVEIKADLDPDVTIFQVTGFVTYLHNQIASGSLVVKNMASYEIFIQNHRDLWAKYDSPKYRAMRSARSKNTK